MSKDVKIPLFTSELIDNYDTILFDCDGVIYYGSSAIPSSVKIVNRLKQLKKDIFYVSNNSSSSREMYVSKLKSYGIDSTIDQMIPYSFIQYIFDYSSGYVAAKYIKSNTNCKTAYVIGHKGLIDEITLMGIDAYGLEDNNNYDFSIDNIDLNKRVDAVVVGFDKYTNFTKLTKAMKYLENKDCLFVSCESDVTYYESNMYLYPANQPNVDFLTSVTNRKPDILTGKPSPSVYQCIQELKPNINKKRTLMIGDSLKTDILFGNNNNLDTLLVLSGITPSLNSVYDENNNIYPTYYINTIGDLDGKI